MSLDSLYPFAGDHAIQNVVFALEWGQELPMAALTQVRAEMAPILAEFPTVGEQQLLRVNVGPLGTQSPTPSPEIGGYSFTRFNALGGIQRAINLSRMNCIVIISDYTHWKSIIAEVGSYFSHILPALGKHAPINAVGLQYTDVFLWKADPSALNLREVFASNSRFIAQNILDVKTLGHSHHGYFLSCDEPTKFNRLDNVNINLTEESGVRSIQILTSHRAVLESPLWTTDESSKNLVSEIEDSLHSVNKSILRDLLSAELLKKIKFD